jgi:hypothetical protein
MSSLSERFKRLPEEQQLRNEESTRQSKEASELLKRLRATRQEAEQVAKEEIERTRRIQREEIEMHPEVIDLKKRLREAERSKAIWERKQKESAEQFEREMRALKRDEENLLGRFNAAQEEENRMREEDERLRRDYEVKEARFKDLEGQLRDLKANEEPQFVNDMKVLSERIGELEGKFSQEEEAKRAIRAIEREIASVQEEREKIEGEQRDFREKEVKVGEDLLKARQMLEEAKRIEGEKQREFDSFGLGWNGVKEAEEESLETERRLKELQESRERAILDLSRRQEMRRTRGQRIERLRSEIDRLQGELSGLEEQDWQDRVRLGDLEHELKGLDIETCDARDRAEYAKRRIAEAKRNEAEQTKLAGELEQVRGIRAEAQNEEKRAVQLCAEIGDRCNEAARQLAQQVARIERLDKRILELGEELNGFEGLQEELQRQQGDLKMVQTRWREWQDRTQRPLLEEHTALQDWLARHARSETLPQRGLRSQALWQDLQGIRSRISNLAPKAIDVEAFEEPQAVREALAAKEAQIGARLESQTGPLSQRFTTQLKREAEALMRAQIAAAHESKQEAIDREARELSTLRVSLNPQVAIDREARTRLWKLNQETAETGQFANQVLELCQSNNITVESEGEPRNNC